MHQFNSIILPLLILGILIVGCTSQNNKIEIPPEQIGVSLEQIAENKQEHTRTPLPLFTDLSSCENKKLNLLCSP